jgi:hypothetical protein
LENPRHQAIYDAQKQLIDKLLLEKITPVSLEPLGSQSGGFNIMSIKNIINGPKRQTSAKQKEVD